MTRTIRMRKVLLSLFCCVFLPLVFGQKKQPSTGPAEQRSFSVEDENVRRPIQVPQAVLRSLAKETDVLESLESQNLTPTALPASWFLASEVHLDGPDEKDIIVIGKGPILGANVTMFWIFRPKSSDYELVMRVLAHSVIIKDTRSMGFRDIEVMSATAVRVSKVLYKFDGRAYNPQGSGHP